MNRLIELATELQKYIGKTAVFHIPGTEPDYLWGTIDCTDDRDEQLTINEIRITWRDIEIIQEPYRSCSTKWLTKILDEDGNELQVEGIKW